MKYFTIKELTKSATAERLHIDNSPNGQEKYNLVCLVDNILDPLRDAWGSPIYVTSGFRCKRLNTAVNGASSSDHMKGCAADINVGSAERNKALYALIVKLDLPFKQLINEVKNGVDYSWIHISYDPTAKTPRKQELRLRV